MTTNKPDAFIPQVWLDEAVERLRRPTPSWMQLPPLPPLTRRQAWALWFVAWRYRIRTAWDVLRDRHDCGDDR